MKGHQIPDTVECRYWPLNSPPNDEELLGQFGPDAILFVVGDGWYGLRQERL